ncbi:uncharacterized protein LTR77_011261 [Saxophila tyrrhenica]|uniref:RNA polymerase alpha subunit domain-containing protein n=1 Tax=Saxophila tyrrhenica TaxID=1690608 RepID=A0AAV9NSZ6_9PEZI|nr:hypothetical protein LTR77_011261 [Saxophila tyrrhenica]
MCIYWILTDTETETRLKEGAEYCREYGSKGMICMDNSKFFWDAHTQMVKPTKGASFVRLGDSVKCCVRNYMKECQVWVDYAVLKPYSTEYPFATAKELYDAYVILTSKQTAGTVRNQTTISNVQKLVSKNSSKKTTRSGTPVTTRHAKVNKTSALYPSDSASQAPYRDTNLTEDWCTTDDYTEAGSVAGWAKTVSNLTRTESMAPSTVSTATIKTFRPSNRSTTTNKTRSTCTSGYSSGSGPGASTQPRTRAGSSARTTEGPRSKRAVVHEDITMETERPFTIERVARAGSRGDDLPLLVSCKWTELKIENMSIFTPRAEHMGVVKGCPVHKNCKGHHMINPDGDVYMIPYGFASGDELRYSDAHALNTAIYSGTKTTDEIATYCFERIKGKNGILRKHCNSTRPTNSMRFVASPPPLDGEWGTIYLPKRLFTNGRFLYLNQDGSYGWTRIKDGDLVVLGRQPSQGAMSAVPVKVRVTTNDEYSVRVPLETCNMNNTDFDGDELWQYKPMSRDAVAELDREWERVWNRSGLVNIKKTLNEIMVESEADMSIDTVMYSTMPLEDMIEHPGGDVYDLLMLKPKNWKVMGQTSFSASYWSTWVERSMDGIVNSTLGKHGIGKPYVAMRNSMMLGTMMVTDEMHLRLRTKGRVPLPALLKTPTMNHGTCSSALTKMTASMYQRGIDMAKHGNDKAKIMAVESLLKMTDECFGIRDTTVSLMSVDAAILSGQPYTKMDYISRAERPQDLLERAITVVSMVEELDNIKLTAEERVAVSALIAFASINVQAIVSDDMVGVMVGMQADWYTSITCSNISWLKTVTRDPNSNVDLTTDISSMLGAIFLGNMSLFAPFGTHSDSS